MIFNRELPDLSEIQTCLQLLGAVRENTSLIVSITEELLKFFNKSTKTIKF